MSTLRAGILGCGGFAHRHAQILAALSDQVEMVAFCSRNPANAQAFADQYTGGQGAVFTDHHTMFERAGLDLVIICLPPHGHTDEVERAAERAERVVRLSDLEDIEHSSEFRELFFEIIWGNATTLERLISVVMAQREAFILEQVRLALEALGLRIPQDVIAAALDGLMLSSLIAAKEGRYTFTSEAFPRILRASGLAQGFRDSLAEMLIEGQELS